MTTPAEYHEFANDCVRWAENAKDASQRETFLSMARLWTVAAFRLEREAVTTADKPALFKEMRTKLD